MSEPAPNNTTIPSSIADADTPDASDLSDPEDFIATPDKDEVPISLGETSTNKAYAPSKLLKPKLLPCERCVNRMSTTTCDVAHICYDYDSPTGVCGTCTRGKKKCKAIGRGAKLNKLARRLAHAHMRWYMSSCEDMPAYVKVAQKHWNKYVDAQGGNSARNDTASSTAKVPTLHAKGNKATAVPEPVRQKAAASQPTAPQSTAKIDILIKAQGETNNLLRTLINSGEKFALNANVESVASLSPATTDAAAQLFSARIEIGFLKDQVELLSTNLDLLRDQLVVKVKSMDKTLQKETKKVVDLNRALGALNEEVSKQAAEGAAWEGYREKIDSHTEVIDSHTEVIDNHTAVIDNHTKVVDNHTKVIKNITDFFSNEVKEQTSFHHKLKPASATPARHASARATTSARGGISKHAGPSQSHAGPSGAKKSALAKSRAGAADSGYENLF